MSINRYSPNHKTFSPHILIPADSPAAYCSTHPCAAAAGSSMFSGALSFNLNNEDEDSSVEDQALAVANDRETIATTQLEREKLFEKPLTPSDVGKLNRLVIPKQHAEKHFPLNGGDPSENGLLLGFEDETGKPWRFRYSYWNSSQSYVLTKGWSRFVKEKRLNAGDIVLFGRHRSDFGRLFIGWRRRSSGQEGGAAQPHLGWNGVVYPAGYSFQRSSPHEGSSSGVYRTDCPNAEKERGGYKKLRLFGVNLEWAEDHEAAEHEHERTWI